MSCALPEGVPSVALMHQCLPVRVSRPAQDIQYSALWQAKLEDCQRRIVTADGAQGGGLKHILRHFSFAPQRFESFAEPRRMYACCLNAVAMLLADIAGDERLSKSIRERAEKSLRAMTAQDILESGLAADFSEVCVRHGAQRLLAPQRALALALVAFVVACRVCLPRPFVKSLRNEVPEEV